MPSVRRMVASRVISSSTTTGASPSDSSSTSRSSRPAHEGGADGQHLALAAGEQARLARPDASQGREVLEDRVGHPPPVEAGDPP